MAEAVDTELAYHVTWKAWKERWDAAKDVPTLLGLLYGIFGLRDPEGRFLSHSEDQARLLLLLEVADKRVYRDGKYTDISKAAHKQLANNFFRSWDTEYHVSQSDRLSFPVLEALLHFFRPEYNSDGDGHIPNLTVRDYSAQQGFDYVEKVTAEFLDRLCIRVWTHEWFQVPVLVDSVLDILAARNKLFVLLPEKQFGRYECMRESDKPRKNWELFTKRSIGKLEEIALRHTSSVEESLYRGNSAAIVLAVACAALAENERVKEKRRLEGLIASANAELRKV